MTQGTSPIPRPNLDAALADTDKFGVGIWQGAMDTAETDDVRARLWDIAKRKEDAGTPDFVPADADDKNVRLLNLINWDPYFIELSARDFVLQTAGHVIGERILLSNYSANIMAPGAGSMVLHADQGYIAEPWPAQALAVNIGWIIDDYTDEVGATRYVPGSNLAIGSPDPDKIYETVPIEGPAGSMIIIDGRVWHTSGTNRTEDRNRAAIFGYYAVPWIRQQVNWREILDEDIVARCSEDYLHLLGYTAGNRELFNPGAMKARDDKIRENRK
ncbi:MAG: phytanoyl-CoA dioxygenase family protein [Rhodospirillales bacterium]|nr:phytanoyl-CoA dioxygenase family protein [Rhodospirillales bacterium]